MTTFVLKNLRRLLLRTQNTTLLSKMWWRFFSSFVAFSEKPNFKNMYEHECPTWNSNLKWTLTRRLVNASPHQVNLQFYVGTSHHTIGANFSSLKIWKRIPSRSILGPFSWSDCQTELPKGQLISKRHIEFIQFFRKTNEEFLPQ